MRRKLFSIATALSLLLCAATAVMWARTRVSGERWWLARAKPFGSDGADWKKLDVNLVNGRVVLVFAELRISSRSGLYSSFGKRPPPLPLGWELGRDNSPVVPPSNNRALWQRLGFQASHQSLPGDFPDSERWTAVGGPFWFVLLLTVPVPYLWWRALRRKARRRSCGLCAACGYNLTGNTSGACPECGTAVAEKAGEGA